MLSSANNDSSLCTITVDESIVFPANYMVAMVILRKSYGDVKYVTLDPTIDGNTTPFHSLTCAVRVEEGSVLNLWNTKIANVPTGVAFWFADGFVSDNNVFEDCAIAIEGKNGIYRVMVKPTPTYTNVASVTNITMNEIGYTGSYITDYQQALTFKA